MVEFEVAARKLDKKVPIAAVHLNSVLEFRNIKMLLMIYNLIYEL